MTPAGEILAAEIRCDGPIPFRRFMEVALYHPELGYYRNARDPFGREGDFYTAEQIQPVFGILMAARIRELYRRMGEPADFTVVELGPGRREMAAAFSEWAYVPVEIGAGDLPERFRGVVFSNEFFDALPVECVKWSGGEPRRMRVGLSGERFVWTMGERAPDEITQYLAPGEEGRVCEVNLEAPRWMERIASSLEAGHVLTIDYGYTAAEAVRFPHGTLMSYRKHVALEDVLADPGERDITAHVDFTALEKQGARRGLIAEGLQTLAQTLLAAGEADQFRAALAGATAEEELRRRMQLKTLLFGMGETFRVLAQRKEQK